MSCAPRAPRRKFTRVSSVQRAPQRGNKPPAQGKRAQRATPWVRLEGFRYAPGGGKSSDRDVQIERTGRSFTPVWRSNRTNGTFIYAGLAFKSNERGVHLCRVGVQIERQFASVIAFAPSGGVSETHLPNPGCRSLRSLALGWELVAPSGRALNAWPLNDIPLGRTLNACHTRKNPLGRALDACGGMSVCYRTTVARRMRTSSKGRLFSSRPTHWMRSTTARPSVISPNTVYWPSR